MSGKGSGARPFSIPRDQFDKKHEEIFGVRKRERWIPPPIGGNDGLTGSSSQGSVLGADGMNGVEDTEGVE